MDNTQDTSLFTSNEINGRGQDKVTRYKWGVKDQPGEFAWVPKSQLHVDYAYQRETKKQRVLNLARDWSWVACGVITVARRPNGALVVIDGGHRVTAAQRRSDIVDMPCMIFEIADIRQEAHGFNEVNTNRKPVPILDRHRARLLSGDPLSVLIAESVAALNLEFRSSAKTVGTMMAVAWCYTRASENKDRFLVVLETAAQLALDQDAPVNELLLEGLWWLDSQLVDVSDGIRDRKVSARLTAVGNAALLNAARRASTYFARGGAGVWGRGMLDEMNKKLRNKFIVKGDIKDAEDTK